MMAANATPKSLGLTQEAVESGVRSLKNRVGVRKNQTLICALIMADIVGQMVELLHKAKLKKAVLGEIRLDHLKSLSPDIDIAKLIKECPLPALFVYSEKGILGEFVTTACCITGAMCYLIGTYDGRMYQALLASGDRKSAAKLLNKIPEDDPHVRCVIEACQETYVKSESVRTKGKEREGNVGTFGLLDDLEAKIE